MGRILALRGYAAPGALYSAARMHRFSTHGLIEPCVYILASERNGDWRIALIEKTNLDWRDLHPVAPLTPLGGAKRRSNISPPPRHSRESGNLLENHAHALAIPPPMLQSTL